MSHGGIPEAHEVGRLADVKYKPTARHSLMTETSALDVGDISIRDRKSCLVVHPGKSRHTFPVLQSLEEAREIQEAEEVPRCLYPPSQRHCSKSLTIIGESLQREVSYMHPFLSSQSRAGILTSPNGFILTSNSGTSS
jgi:hypothetical protein